MTELREATTFYQISETRDIAGNPDNSSLVAQLNYYLGLISERLDRIEGKRGIPTFYRSINMRSNKITGASLGTTSGEVLTADLDSNPGLAISTSGIKVVTKEAGGLSIEDLGIYVVPKQDGGVTVDDDGVSVDVAKIDHGELKPASLTHDDHTQYALLLGRSGGQILYGGTAASDDLTIDSTYNSTKGDVISSSRILLSGSGIVYKDYNLGAVSLGRGAAAPGLVNVNSSGVYLPAFDGGATTEELFGSIELDHDWEEGTEIVCHLHWMPSTTDVGNVKWQLTYHVLDDGDTAGGGTSIYVTTAAGGTAWVHKVSSFPAITTSGKTIGSQFSFRLFRDPTDGADSYGADALVMTVGLHVKINTMGSREIGTK